MNPISRAGKFILMLWGAPAAGKTTVARSLLDQARQRRGLVMPHLSTDQLSRALIGDTFIGALRPALYEGLLSMAGQIVADGGCVLLDGTFLSPRLRAQVRELAERRRAVLLSVQVTCGLNTRMKRNDGRGADQRVPHEWIRRAHYQARAAQAQADLVVDTDELSPPQAVDAILELLAWRMHRGSRFPDLIRQVPEGKAYCAGL